MEDSKRVKYLIWGCVAGAMLSLILMVSTCQAQTNGNFGRVRLVPTSTVTSTDERNGTIKYIDTLQTFRFYQNGGWLNLVAQTQEIQSYSTLGSVIQAQSIPIEITTTGANMVGAREHFVAIYLTAGQTITGVKWFQTVAGDYTAADSNKVGLYSYSAGTLTRVAQSISDDDIFKNLGLRSKAFQTSYTVTATGTYFVALLWNRSAQVTAPTLSSGTAFTVSPILDFTNSAKLYSYVAGKVDFDATIASSALTLNQIPFWVAVY